VKIVYSALMILALTFLSACGMTPQGDFVRGAIKERGADAYDAGLENSEWFMCEAASAGSVRRKYGKSPELAAAYRTLCTHAADPLLP